MNRTREVLVDGLGYLEGSRWHEGALWFSDIQQRTIYRLVGRSLQAVTQVEPRPSGLGWEPDGSTLAISMEDSALIRLQSDGDHQIVHDFGGSSRFINDMVVDTRGRAYISQFGYDLFGGEQARATGLLVRHLDGTIAEYGQGLTFPNGIAIAPDGRTLVVAESFGVPRSKLTAFDIDDDGALSNQRLFAEFDTPDIDVPDGLCIDAEGAVWVAICRGEFRRVVDGGEVTDVIAIPAEGGNYCVDCALGGENLDTLFMLIADTTVERMGNNWDSSARVEAVQVDVPGFIPTV